MIKDFDIVTAENGETGEIVKIQGRLGDIIEYLKTYTGGYMFVRDYANESPNNYYKVVVHKTGGYHIRPTEGKNRQ